MSLAGRQLGAARVVRPVQSGGAVHYQQGVPDTQVETQSVCVCVLLAGIHTQILRKFTQQKQHKVVFREAVSSETT